MLSVWENDLPSGSIDQRFRLFTKLLRCLLRIVSRYVCGCFLLISRSTDCLWEIWLSWLYTRRWLSHVVRSSSVRQFNETSL